MKALHASHHALRPEVDPRLNDSEGFSPGCPVYKIDFHNELCVFERINYEALGNHSSGNVHSFAHERQYGKVAHAPYASD